MVIVLELSADWGKGLLLHPKTPLSHASFISRLVLPFRYRLTQVVLEKRPLHTHTHLTALPGRAGTRKVKPIWILLKQETVSGSGISWGHMQVCTLLLTDNQASTPPVSFLQAGCPSCRPTNDIKALKAQKSPLNGCNSSSSSTSMFYCCCLSYLVSNIMMFTTVSVGMATFTQQCFVSVNITCLG